MCSRTLNYWVSICTTLFCVKPLGAIQHHQYGFSSFSTSWDQVTVLHASSVQHVGSQLHSLVRNLRSTKAITVVCAVSWDFSCTGSKARHFRHIKIIVLDDKGIQV